MKPKISTVCPIYNGGGKTGYLQRQVKSILSQNYEPNEIILIDDGSTDDSGAICDRLALTDERIIVVHRCNAGEASARNLGIRLSSGDYLHIVDQDNQIKGQMYQEMMKFSDDLPDVIKSGYTISGDNGSTSKKIINSHPTDTALYRDYIVNNIIPYTIETSIDETKKFSGHWSMLTRLNLIKGHDIFYDESLPKMNDSKFMVDVLAKAKTAIFSNECYYDWIRRSGSLTSHYSQMFKGISEVTDYYENLFSNEEYGYDFCSQDKISHNIRFTLDSLELIVANWKTVNIYTESRKIFSDEHCKNWFRKYQTDDILLKKLKKHVDNDLYLCAITDYLIYFVTKHLKSHFNKSK